MPGKKKVRPQFQQNQQEGKPLDFNRVLQNMSVRIANLSAELSVKDAMIEQAEEELQELRKQIDELAKEMGNGQEGATGGPIEEPEGDQGGRPSAPNGQADSGNRPRGRRDLAPSGRNRRRGGNG